MMLTYTTCTVLLELLLLLPLFLLLLLLGRGGRCRCSRCALRNGREAVGVYTRSSRVWQYGSQVPRLQVSEV